MTLAQQIFAIAPAMGEAHLTPLQEQLLEGKAKWLHVVVSAGLPVVPTICVTRLAWAELQSERQAGGVRMRTAFVATLFKLVGMSGVPPTLVVRTSAGRRATGLMRARTNIAAPAQEADAVDPSRPLARAIEQALDSYGDNEAVWHGAETQFFRDRQIVLVQAQVANPLFEFASRDLHNGQMGPAPLTGRRREDYPAGTEALAQTLDAAAGQHMACLATAGEGGAQLVSARPIGAGAAAELEAAVDRVAQGIWSPRQAVANIDPARLPQLLHPHLVPDPGREAVARGAGVSPGAASGIIVFSPEDAGRMRARGIHCVLVVTETGPNDVDGLKAATGVLTGRGGPNGHAAIIARVFGKPCVADVRSLQIDAAALTCKIGSLTLKQGEKITIDGSDGSIYLGALPLEQPHIGGAMGRLLEWSDGSRTISVRTNAETVASVKTALSFGAEGIGLARSEHMFFSPERMVALRRLILSDSEADRRGALTGLIDYQSGDYAELFAAMKGKPVNIRLFDPPLHEFLPRTDEDVAETASSLGIKVEALKARIGRLAEANPMLGHRGCRLVVTYPEILDMQLQAMLAGARQVIEEAIPVNLEIMVPFVSSAREVAWVRSRVDAIVAAERLGRSGRDINVAFGTMIELPRAALRAGDIAPIVDFFSFGTNDLTQTTFGLSRDDAAAFLPDYQRKGLYDHDPFMTLDQKGVGELIAIAVQRGRAANPNLKIGICGEHAGDPASIGFFAGLGIDYVSCSPYRVPVARLALAQARR